MKITRMTLAMLPLTMLCTCVCAAAGAVTTQPATTQASAQQFLRFVDDGKGGGRLESAIVSFRDPTGVTVDLIAAVHVGEKAYYKDLAARFETYDALLYELVKPRDSEAPQPGAAAHGRGAVGGLQRSLRDLLKLDFQLDDIDYTRPNFVHADLDAETFFDQERQRGESIWGLMFDAMLDDLFRQMAGTKSTTQPTGLDLLAALTSPDRAGAMKMLLARQFDDLEEKLASFDGTVLVTERNKAAIAALEKSIKDGKRKLAIFYGAAHMPDLRQRLIEMGFEQTGAQWKTAWDVPAPAPRPISTTRPATLPAR